MDFKKKGNSNFFNNDLLFKTVGVIFLLCIVFFAVADIKIYKKKIGLASQVLSYQKQIADIKKSSQNLNNEIKNADNKDYLEKLGYEQFDQARPGETVYMFVKSDKKIGPGGFLASDKENFWNVNMWLSKLAGGFNWFKSKF